MKSKILRELREAGEAYVSGAGLCEKFGVSRQAVWKNITALKEMGYVFESVSNKGYRLIETPDKLCAPEIKSLLPEQGIIRKVEYFDSIDSTNIRAKQMAELGEAEGTLLIADKQTAGKGRRGRSWEGEAGTGIYMTLLLRPKLSPHRVSGLTLLAALALARSIKEISGLEVQIKWPNDVVADGKKICGILTEMSSEEEFIHYVVVGIGINANMTVFPEPLQNTATSICLQTGQRVNRSVLAARTMEIFCEYYKGFERDGNLSAFVQEYNRVLANYGKEVKVYYGMIEDATEENTETGIAKGIDEDGALLVEVGGVEKKIVSGEVSVRGLYGYV